MAHLLQKEGLFDYQVASAGVSDEEFGHDINPKSAEQLQRDGIPLRPHFAHQITKQEIENAEWILVMDDFNFGNLQKRTSKEHSKKVHLLLEYTGQFCDVDDPWYTNDYGKAYREIRRGCEAFLEHLKKSRN